MPKYLIRASRFINGNLVHASPEFPATIELPAGTKVDPLMFPVGDPRGTVKPLPHFNPTNPETGILSAIQLQGTPVPVPAAEVPAEPVTAATEVTPKGQGHGKQGKRASDTDI